MYLIQRMATERAVPVLSCMNRRHQTQDQLVAINTLYCSVTGVNQRMTGYQNAVCFSRNPGKHSKAMKRHYYLKSINDITKKLFKENFVIANFIYFSNASNLWACSISDQTYSQMTSSQSMHAWIAGHSLAQPSLALSPAKLFWQLSLQQAT